MPCSGKYADVIDFAIFWCLGGLETGVDNSGLQDQAFLTDTTADFVAMGVEPAMLIQNVTDGSSGLIILVTVATITATLTGGSGNDWDNGDIYRLVGLGANEQAQIDTYLSISAADIHAALASVGACDCTLAGWAGDFLKKLNIIEAVVIHSCPCGKAQLSEEMRRTWLEWLNVQFEMIRTSAIDVCAGETGEAYPYTAWAEQGVSEFAKAQIILNKMLREQE